MDNRPGKASSMVGDSARTDAQERDHELPPNVFPNPQGKAAEEPTTDSSQPSIKLAKDTTLAEKRDIEARQIRGENPPQVKVPRSKRRGLFGRFTLLAEVEEPKHYSRRKKWWITFVVALAAIAAPMGSTIIFRRPSQRNHPIA